MELAEEQRRAVAGWIESGLGTGEVQKRIKDEFGISLTYLEMRLLMDDLKVRLPKEPEKEKDKPDEPSPAGANLAGIAGDEEVGGGSGKVRVAIDQIARPNALFSGKVTFSDGQTAEWQLDNLGRLGLNPSSPGYRPSQQDVMAFQVELQRLAQSQGF